MSPDQVAFISTYPPRRCGIATFTRDLRTAVGGGRVAALYRPDDPVLYPMEVAWRIAADRRPDYARIAGLLRRSGSRVASVQHEYGIFGGPDGAYVLDLLDGLSIPAVATLHTVPARPTPGQHEVLSRIVDRATTSVVMSASAARLLHAGYGAPWSRIRVIHHGVPDLALIDPNERKPEFDLTGRTVILSFGLLGPGKGYEWMIEAMDHIRREAPNALYVVLGATHPDLVRSEGEAYRDRLRERVATLGLADHVRFVDRFIGTAELGRWLQAADIFVTPYPNLDQIVSGTLSYAVGAGKAVVSTPYSYARELLDDDRGVLVETGSAIALADGILPLLHDPIRRSEMGRRAHAFGRRMVWSQVGAAYREVFAQAVEGTGTADLDEAGATRRRVDVAVHA